MRIYYLILLLLAIIVGEISCKLYTKEFIQNFDWNSVKIDNEAIDPENPLLLPVVNQKSATAGRKPNSRIVGGNVVSPAEQEQYKYLVKLITPAPTIGVAANVGMCGGSLIAKDWVITAGHCLRRKDREDHPDTLCFFGVLDDRLGFQGQWTVVDQPDFHIHPDFQRDTLKNDIAMMKLVEPVTFTATVGPISLPPIQESCLFSVGKNVLVSGWGQTGDKTYTNELKSVTVRIASPDECKRTWTHDKAINHDLQICADATGNAGVCFADSGGPMAQIRQNETPILIGVTSFISGRGCQTNDHRIFTCINGYRNWIQRTVGYGI